MAEANETQTQGASEETKERTFTQAEVEETIKERLARERKKYADYAALKEKAEKFDQAEEAAKSDLQKATERADALKKELDGLKAAQARAELVATVAKDAGVDAEILAAMSGASEEEIRANAKLVKEKLAAIPGYKADPHDNGGQQTKPPKKHEVPTVF